MRVLKKMIKENKIIQGDCLEKLKELESESVNCCMTSPPYWALRDYGVDKQLGLEPTFQEYINKLCDIFDEVKRVLRKDGTCWVNIGDTYNSHSTGKGNVGGIEKENKPILDIQAGNNKTIDLQDKSLCNIPARFSIEMQNRGWILRNVIIWYKPNCMPISVTDRFTVDFEYLYFFVKSKKYWFEQQTEKQQNVSIKRAKYKSFNRSSKLNGNHAGMNINNFNSYLERISKEKEPMRNKRAVWTITTKPFSEAHFAVYPEELCETPIKAGCPEFVCNNCGKAREIIEEIDYGNKPKYSDWLKTNNEGKYKGIQPMTTKGYGGEIFAYRKEIWGIDAHYGNIPKKRKLTDCGCNAGFSGGIVLDPFFGAGTTGIVALKQNKKFIGIELNPEYIKIIEDRLKPYMEQKKLNL